MRKRILALLLMASACVSVTVKAQQQPLVSQYMLNNAFLNPAYRGSGEQLSLTALHRAQWAGYEDYTGKRAAQKLDFFQASFNPDSTGHNAGLQFVYDKLGSLSTTSVQLSYAYRIAMTKRAGLSVGVRGGITSKAINFADARVLHAGDPNIPEGNPSQTRPDITLGLWLDHERYYVGVSARGFVTTADFDALGVPNEQLLSVTAGYHARLTPEWTMTPSVQLMNTVDHTVAEMSLLFQQENKVWAGVSYRHEEAAVVMLGFGLLEQKLRLGYAYDYVTSNRSIKTGSSHEIMLRYCLGRWHAKKHTEREGEE